MGKGRVTVAPTIAGRIQALDVLRGFAVLGILFANLAAFSGPDFSESMAGSRQPSHGFDAWVNVLTSAFVTGKFRSTLAILFGVGLYLQFAKRSAIQGNWPGGYLKRTAWLAVFGAIHGLLIWYGDILFAYAVTAFISCMFVRIAPKAMNWVTIAFIAATVVIGFGLAGLVWLASVIPDAGSGADMAAGRAAELHAYGAGSYWEQTLLRMQAFGYQFLALFFLLPTFAGLFLVGIRLGMAGFLSAPSRHVRLRNRLLWIGWGAGLPLNLLALLYWRTGGVSLL
jgi:uncharacterized protein